MFGNTFQPVMFPGLLLFLSICLGISGIADGRRRRAAKILEDRGVEVDCPRIRYHTPDQLHFITLSDAAMDLSAFYNPRNHVQVFGIGRNHSQSGYLDDNNIRVSERVTGFLPKEEQDVADECINVGPCDRTAKYRTISGTCNNLRHPMWGSTGAALVRLLPATYQDGEHNERRSQSGKDLPNVRHLSSSLFRDINAPDMVNMYNVMQWGQLVAHDTVHTVQPDVENQGLECCHASCMIHTDICMPVAIPSNDPFYNTFHQTCINFGRSVTTNDHQCPLSPRQQIITATHFLDASVVYGSTDKVAKKLRAHRDGLLEVRPTKDGREFPPQSDTPKATCDNVGGDTICYELGDDRGNLNTGLTVLIIVLMREHNFLARELKNFNPHWDDERLYQEARKIVGAEIQRITYDAYLPIILGYKTRKAYGLFDGQGDEDFMNDYDEELNPSTLNSFATAAFRAFHSQIPREIVLYDEGFSAIKKLNIDDFYFRPTIIQRFGMFDKLLRGLAVQPSQSQDPFFSVGITDYLFKSSKPYGKDLESLDIQRGRDHGLPTYNDFRRACGLKHASHFGELLNFMPEDAVKILDSKFETVDDIDLFVGGMSETRESGALLGPTFSCIIGEQFKRWRNGDRFYYEFGDQAGSFTHDQLKEIRKITLAELFCRNGDDIDRMTLDAFHAPNILNPITNCKHIMKLDLSPWKEEQE